MVELYLPSTLLFFGSHPPEQLILHQLGQLYLIDLDEAVSLCDPLQVHLNVKHYLNMNTFLAHLNLYQYLLLIDLLQLDLSNP